MKSRHPAVLLFGALVGLGTPTLGAAQPPPCTDQWRERRPLVADVRAGRIPMLCYANLTSLDLTGVNLVGANLSDADLSDANLTRARLQGALLVRTKLDRVREWHLADLCRASFEPNTLPPVEGIARAAHLWALRYEFWPGSLTALREGFKKAGLPDHERQITFAVQRGRALRVWQHDDWLNNRLRHLTNHSFLSGGARLYADFWYPTSADVDRCVPDGLSDVRPWPGGEPPTVSEKIESLFSFAAFNLTSAYGLYPGRPMRILGLCLLIFTVPYLVALNRERGGGIWAVLLADRVRRRKPPGDPMVRVTVRGLAREPAQSLLAPGPRYMLVPLRVGWRVVRTAFYFSLLSAFSIGWKELNVGTWLTRVQRREYTLRGTGWVRMVSGVQALLSVYLLALWALTYFSRPFE